MRSELTKCVKFQEKVINEQMHYSLDNKTWKRYTYEQLTILYDTLKKSAIGEADSNAVLGAVPDTICPFCGENGFDFPGLKSHLEHGDCEKYNTVETIHRLF